ERLRRDCDHGLIEQPEPFAAPAVANEDVALSVNGEREQIGVAEALADLGCCGRRGGRALPVALRLVLEDDGHEHVALLDTLALLLLEQPLGAAEPPRLRTHLSSKRKLDTDPERAAHR